MHFNGKVIWITGASSGIGAVLAAKLSTAGALLILTARNVISLEHVKNECIGTNCIILPADLTDFDAEQVTQKAIGLFGHIDIVIHCAGVSQRSLATDTSIDVYRQLMEVNFFAPITITKYLLPHFDTRPASQIIVVGSMAGLMGFPKRTGYAAAKHALKGYFETLQVEHSVSGMDITIVSPGRINTPISLAALNGEGGRHNIMDKEQLNGIPVSICADKIIKAIRNRKKHVTIARGERLLWWLWWFIPSVYYKIARSAGNKTNK